MPFFASCMLFALLPAALAGIFGWAVVNYPSLWRTLPREKHVGIALGVVCLIWSAFYAVPMLEGGMARFQPAVKLLVPVIAVLAYFHLNFLFTRALGGLMMLSAVYMLHAAFVAQVPARPLFSAVCYLVAIAGMFALATPWRFRDLLRQCVESRHWRRGLVAGHASLAVALAVFAILGAG